MSTANTPDRQENINVIIQEQYVKRIRARLGRASISIEESRDGMLDCFVSTYFEGLKSGLKAIIGVQAEPEEVARVAAGIFRRRLLAHGATFEKPTVEALSAIKEETDKELHFSELPAEIKATHDQVCSLLIAKAEGTLEHTGDRSSVQPTVAKPVVSTPTPAKPAAPAKVISSPPIAAPKAPPSSVANSLRAVLNSYLEECGRAAIAGDPVASLTLRLARVQKLLETISEFEPTS